MKNERSPAPEGPQPKPVSRRAVGLLMLAWTGLILGWFLSLAASGTLVTPGAGVAVGGLVGGVWLIGLLMLAMFIASPPD